VDRYWRFMRNLSVSTVFRRILSPCATLTAAAFAVCAYNLALVPLAHAAAASLPASVALLEAPLALLPLVSLNLAPFSLISPMVGLLLVFRTNFSYARFLEGRLLWGAAVRHCRDVARLTTAYLPPSAARAALLGHLQAWAWLLKAHLRAGRTRATPGDPTAYRDDPSRDVRACLPPALAEPLLAASNRPFVTLCALTALLRHVRGGLPDYATRRIEETICDMGAVTGGCERILSTPMPLSYTRFTGRALVAWLMTLPLALWPLTGWATPLVMFALSYVTLGIDECGVEIEEPFCILPLQALCEAIRRDVGIAERAGAAGMAAWPSGVSGNGKGNGKAADAAAAV
jgi:predicted membrane chloride channel (bestrophin family)